MWYTKEGIAKITLILGIITGVLVFIGTVPLGWGNAIGWGLLVGFGIALCGKVYSWLFGEKDDDAASRV